jgi:hypothetical protein
MQFEFPLMTQGSFYIVYGKIALVELYESNTGNNYRFPWVAYIVS